MNNDPKPPGAPPSDQSAKAPQAPGTAKPADSTQKPEKEAAAAVNIKS